MLRVPPTGMRGDVLADALTRPSAAARTTQKERSGELAPLVLALQHEAYRELAQEK